MNPTTVRTTRVSPVQWIFGRARIGTKIMSAVFVTAAIFVVVTVIGIAQARTLSADAEELYSQKVVGLTHISSLRSSVAGVQQAVLLHLVATGRAEQARWQEIVDRRDSEIDVELGALRGLKSDSSRIEQLDAFARSHHDWTQHRDEALRLSSAGDRAGASRVVAYKAQAFADQSMAEMDKLFTGVVADVRDASTLASASTRRTERLIATLLLAGVALASLLAVASARAISRPLRRTVGVLNAVADGDFTQQLEVTSRDEVGEMAMALNRAVSLLRATLEAVGDNVVILASASDELAAVSCQMAQNAEETASQAAVVSESAAGVSSSVHTVAVAAEELNASIRDVAQHAAAASTVAGTGATGARSAEATVNALGESSSEIESIAQLISGIAHKTHLLALNATIEAARAGAAGYGFAVVAHEVKELAAATASATQQVQAAVIRIQAGVGDASAGIGEVARVIDVINDSQANIAGAVEEQTATTNDIGRSASEAANGSAEIARNIAAVAQATKSTTEGAAQSQVAAADLSRMASDLRILVGQFRC